MNRYSTMLVRIFCSVLLLLTTIDCVNAGSKVELRREGGRFQLLRNGEPYVVHGAGGTSRLDQLKAAGGNSIRTWGVEGVAEILDEAQRHGLSVCVGMWLQHERHGFDYSDAAAVKKQHEECLQAVKTFKDHPAVLLWGVGNEMEGEGNNPEIWKAVNDIAKDIHRIDPDHPTMTVIAELGEGGSKIKALETHCPNIDIVGINSYGGISSVAKRFNESGCTKPYIVTEHGPVGPWETAKTSWGSPIEATSTEKGRQFFDGYKAAVIDNSDVALGSYAFLWGNKQETTATWFGMMLPDGTRLAAVDAMSQHWTGQPPRNRCPEIKHLELNITGPLKAGSTVRATVTASDRENDSLTYRWVLTSDSKTIGVGGDFQETESELKNAVVADGATATLHVPDKNGAFRLFVYVKDGQGGGAVANLPLQIGQTAPTAGRSEAAQATLPFAIFSDESPQTTFVPSGYMGNAEAVKMDMQCTHQPHAGRTCLKASYNSRSEWGGVLWQSPANDWDGKLPGGANFTGAEVLEFWARGERGGEVVNFVFGVLDGDQPFRDTAKGELKNVKLTKSWKKYQFPLKDKDLSRIKTSFGWSLAGQSQPVTFYLDDIVFKK